MQRVIVTGCTGVTGNALVEHLLGCGFSVYAMVRPGSRRLRFLPEHSSLHVIECGLGEYGKLAKNLSGDFAAFFHLAWEGSHGERKAELRDDMSMQLENVKHMLEAVEACRSLKCPVFLATGSQAEYGPGKGVVDEMTPCFPINGYGAAKLCASEMASVLCRKYGIRFIWARLFSVYGPKDCTHSMIDAAVVGLLAGAPPAYTEGKQIWNYLYSKDAAKALVLLAFTESAEGVYCVASRKSRMLREYIRELHETVAPEFEPALGVLSAGASSVRMEVDTSRLVNDTGFKEAYDFGRGIGEIRDWYKYSAGLGELF